MNKMTINLKLQLMVFIAIAVTAISLVIVNITSLNNLLEENTKIYKKDITRSKVAEIKEATKFATIIVESYYIRIENYTKKFLKKNMDALLNVLNATYMILRGGADIQKMR